MRPDFVPPAETLMLTLALASASVLAPARAVGRFPANWSKCCTDGAGSTCASPRSPESSPTPLPSVLCSVLQSAVMRALPTLIDVLPRSRRMATTALTILRTLACHDSVKVRGLCVFVHVPCAARTPIAACVMWYEACGCVLYCFPCCVSGSSDARL